MQEKKKSTKKWKTKFWERERERYNLLCVERLCIKWEREVWIYSKRNGIRKTKTKGR